MPLSVYLANYEARNSGPERGGQLNAVHDHLERTSAGLAHPLEVHKFCSMLPAFTFEARPVIPVSDAIRVELEAMAYRDGLKQQVKPAQALTLIFARTRWPFD
jgi:hypothetical protein